jgi:putative transcriptional regulator
VYFINSIEVLRGLLEKDKSIASQTMKYFAGYAAWSPGQLDAELAQGDWHMAAASETTVFSKDVDGIWMELVEKLEGTWVLLDNPSSKRGN